MRDLTVPTGIPRISATSAYGRSWNTPSSTTSRSGSESRATAQRTSSRTSALPTEGSADVAASSLAPGLPTQGVDAHLARHQEEEGREFCRRLVLPAVFPQPQIGLLDKILAFGILNALAPEEVQKILFELFRLGEQLFIRHSRGPRLAEPTPRHREGR